MRAQAQVPLPSKAGAEVQASDILQKRYSLYLVDINFKMHVQPHDSRTRQNAHRRAVLSWSSLSLLLLSKMLSWMVEASLKPSRALPVMLLLPPLPGPQLGRSEHSGSDRDDSVSPADSYSLDAAGLAAARLGCWPLLLLGP